MQQMLDAVRNTLRLPDLRRKLLYTLFILLVYQFAAHIPVPGVNTASVKTLTSGNSAAAGFLQVLDLLSGGAISQFSILAMGVYPYITAQIILQLLTGVIPQLEAIAQEPGGQEKLNSYTYYLAIPMALLQAVGQVNILRSLAQQSGAPEILPGYGAFNLTTVVVLVTMTAGTMFAIWLGELITEQGIGNGLSLIIFAGIVSQVPRSIGLLLGQSAGYEAFNLLAFIVLTAATIIFIVMMESAVRRIPVQYGRRVRGRKQYGGGSTHIPLRVNSAGMIPLIFAQAIVTFPAILAGIFWPQSTFYQTMQNTFGSRQGLAYWGLEFILVVAFTYFYTDVTIQNQKLWDSLQKQAGFIPGIRPGNQTKNYITKVTRRITAAGAMYLGIVTIIPGLFYWVDQAATGSTNIVKGNDPSQVISSAGLIIDRKSVV